MNQPVRTAIGQLEKRASAIRALLLANQNFLVAFPLTALGMPDFIVNALTSELTRIISDQTDLAPLGPGD